MEKIGKDKESKTEKRNQRELLWFQTGGALNFITAAPHCGDNLGLDIKNNGSIIKVSMAHINHKIFLNSNVFKSTFSNIFWCLVHAFEKWYTLGQFVSPISDSTFTKHNGSITVKDGTHTHVKHMPPWINNWLLNIWKL
jgi:hypothetical protein